MSTESPVKLVCTPSMKQYFGTAFDISLDEEIFDLRDEAKEIRRYLHSNAELSFKEFNTSKYILSYLNKLNSTLNGEKLIIKQGFGSRSKTGITCLLKGTKKPNHGFCIGLRADIDALPITETNNDIEYKSKNKNAMHACGHDAHTSILLITCKILCKYRDKLSCNIKFLFQPGEEIGGGAIDMIKYGALNDVNQIYGLHVISINKLCTFGINKYPKPLLAGASSIKLIINGKGGHGAMPHLSNDVTIALTSLIQQFQTIISRNMNPNEMGVITIGKIDSGYKGNVIADKGILEGTIRFYNNNNRNLLKNRIKEICNGIEKSFGVNIEIIYPSPDYPPTINREIGYNNICNVAKKIINNNEGLLLDEPPLPGAEDFSEYLNVRPGAFFFLGAKVEPPKDKPDEIYMHHDSSFKIDEKMMVVGCQIFVQLVFDLMNQKPLNSSESNKLVSKL